MDKKSILKLNKKLDRLPKQKKLWLYIFFFIFGLIVGAALAGIIKTNKVIQLTLLHQQQKIQQQKRIETLLSQFDKNVIIRVEAY